MGIFTRLAETIFGGATFNPSWLRTWMTEVERLFTSAVYSERIYGALADLEADLAHPANTGALVIGDSAANDGVYRKTGASGAGEWIRVGDLPGYSFVVASDDGGTANAIAATTALPVNGSQLITVPIVLANTGPVTVSFNGGPALAVETKAGNDIAPGGLPAGSEMTGRISGSTFRLLSDQASAAIQAAAEAAADRAEAAAAGLNLPSIVSGDAGKQLVVNAAEDGYELLHPNRYFLDPADFEAVGDGSADDLSALEAVFAEHNSSGVPINLGEKTYAISALLDYTFTRKPVIYGHGATIKLTTASGIARAVDLIVDEHGFDFRGWKVDADSRAYNGLVIRNTAATDMTAADIERGYGEDIGAINVYRSGTDHVGGFGIWIDGGFESLHLVRPYVKGVKLAENAGVQASIGVHGIAILNAGSAEARDVTIDDPWIEDVYSEDADYIYDQDGIQIFGVPPATSAGYDGFARINGGTFKNCWGRSVKFAKTNCRIRGSHFIRTTGNSTGRGFMEVDFQYGDGIAEELTYHHDGHSVEKIVSGTIGNYVHGGLRISGIRGYAETGTTAMDSIVLRTHTASHQASPTIVENVSHGGVAPGAILEHSGLRDTSGFPAEHIVIRDCHAAELSTALLRRDSVAGTVAARIENCSQAGSAVALVSNAGSADTLVSEAGNKGFTAQTFTGTMTGLTTSPTGSISAKRNGDTVTLSIPSISGTSNSTSCSITGMPTSFRPAAARQVNVTLIDNGGYEYGGVGVIGTNGVIALYPTPLLGSFTASGTKGITACQISYVI